MLGFMRALRAFCLVGGLAALPAAALARDSDPFAMMSAGDVAKRLGEKTFYTFDANSEKSYVEGHVPGARHVDFAELTAAQLPSDKQSTLVFYCMNPKCMASHEAAKKAAGFGYPHVFVMPQGIQGWKASGEPVVAGAQPGEAPKKTS